jgi:hypothetical protein
MAAKRTFQVFVGFLLGGFAAQLIGFFGIWAVQIAHGHFEIEHLLYLSLRERLFLALLPCVPAILLLRRRPYVSAGMVLSAGFFWILTVPS